MCWEVIGLKNGDARALFAEAFQQETGAVIPSDFSGYHAEDVFRKGELRDVLDAVTLMSFALEARASKALAQQWIQFCQRAFKEEGVPYRVDDDGTVHYLVDVAFYEAADATVAVLARPPFTAAHDSIRSALEALTKAQPETTDAIRDTFVALETLVKVVTNTTNDLTERNVESQLRPLIDRRYKDADVVAKGACTQALESLKDWVNACHKYRHGHKVEASVDPPLELAILLVNNGLGFARWLATLPSA